MSIDTSPNDEMYDVYWMNPGYGWEWQQTLPKAQAQAEARRIRAAMFDAKIEKTSR